MKKQSKSGLIVFIVILVLIAGIICAAIFIPKNGPDSVSYVPISEQTEEEVQEEDTEEESDKESDEKEEKKSEEKGSEEEKEDDSEEDKSDKKSEKDKKPKEKKKSPRLNFIAAIYINGVIEEANSEYNQQWILQTVENLKKNKKNAALALYIDSPGGAVYQADELYLALMDYKETTGRPIYVYQGPMAASGGYYISCAGDKIYANRNTLTGSIGVISGTSFDMTGLLNKAGIKSTTFHSGRNKNMLNFDEPLTWEQKTIMESIGDECYDQFVSIVSEARDISYDKTKKLSDGRIYTAKQALDNGLIDEIDSWQNMLIDLAENEIKIPGIKVVTYKRPKQESFIDKIIASITNFKQLDFASETGIPVSVVDKLNNFDSYPAYLYNANY